MNEQPDCPICLKPCDLQGAYSTCCHALIARNTSQNPGDAITAPDDITENDSGRSSKYFGVFKIRRQNGVERWRVKFCRKGVTCHVGEFESELNAARVFDNAAYWTAKELGDKIPPLNFPNTYAFDAMRPPIWAATRRVLHKIKSAFLNQ